MVERGYIRGLDGLRALAVLMVFAEHRIWVGSWMNLGRLGVEIFFVLSGFLIVGILARRRALIDDGRERAWPEIKNFFLHRSFRIFPAYYLMLGMVAVGTPLVTGIPYRWDYLLYNLTYTTNLALGYVYGEYPPGIVAHAWTLAIEEQFYILAAPLFLLLPSRLGPAACIGTVILACASALILQACGYDEFTVGMDSFFNFGFLALGGYIAQVLPPAAGKSVAAPLAAFGLCIPIAAYSLAAHPVGGRANELVWLAMGIAAGAMVAQVVRNQASPLVAALEWSPLKFLGRISYGFYLYHTFIALPQIGPGFFNMYPVTITLNFVGTVIVAGASWYLFERPILELRDRVLKRTPSASAPPLPSIAEAHSAVEVPNGLTARQSVDRQGVG